MLELYSDQPGVQLYTGNYMPDPNNEVVFFSQSIKPAGTDGNNQNEPLFLSFNLDLSEWQDTRYESTK